MKPIRIYHLGLMRRGRRYILEVADDLDQLNCELWQYLGPRETSIARLERNRHSLLIAFNDRYQADCLSLVVHRVATGDYTAGAEDVR